MLLLTGETARAEVNMSYICRVRHKGLALTDHLGGGREGLPLEALERAHETTQSMYGIICIQILEAQLRAAIE